ncbi:MAG: tetratricopeptide repeat protein [Pirellulales bacterium]
MAQPATLSPPQKAATSEAATPWILNGWRDLLLFVATPALIVPLVYLARARYSVESIALFVAAFGACGHHLPGMMRAYGDRELFERFKARFVVAPVFLLAVCLAASWFESQTLAVVALLWGFWHGLAQVYGFARIYDAKSRSFAPLTARLDLALCFTWFGLGMLYSPGRLYGLLNAFYAAGGPLIPPDRLAGLRQAWLLATVLATAAFAGNFVVRKLRGEPQSLVKVGLLASSIGFWCYAMLAIDNVVLGIALFEVFHDVQYLAIVWIYNRRRVERPGGMAGGFTRFLFRRSGLMVGLYLGMIFAYGALSLIQDQIQMDAVKRLLTGLLVFSTLLHFYYDGFIWKVRERSTREGLGLAGGKAQADVPRIPGWLRHSLMWSLFVIPAALSAYGEARGGSPRLSRQENLAAAVPLHAEAQYELAVALQNDKRLAEAAAHFALAVELKPEHAQAQYQLANWRRQSGDFAAAIEHYRLALRYQPDYADAQNNLASTLFANGQADAAQAELLKLLQQHEDHAAAHNNLADLLTSQGDYSAAIAHYRRALQADPGYFESRQGLAMCLAMHGESGEAIAEYRRTIELFPMRGEPHMALGMVLYRQGQPTAALAEFERAAELLPTSAAPWSMQAWLLATSPDGQVRHAAAAVRHGEKAVELGGETDAEAFDALAAALASAGDFAGAIHQAQTALAAARQSGLSASLMQGMRDRLSLYRQGKPYRETNAGAETSVP